LVTFAALVSIEAIARVILTAIYDRRFPRALIQSGRYGTTDGLRPGAAGRVWGEDFHVDESGGRVTGRPAADGRPCWLYLGDSVGEGVGVADSTCAISIAARKTDCRVVNLCHIGHGTCDQLEVLQRWTDTCTAIRRVTVLYTLNDAYGRSTTVDLPPLRRPDGTAVLREWLQDHVSAYRLVKLIVLQGSDHYFRYDRAFYSDGDPRLKATLQCLGAIRSICAQRNIALDVVMLPYRSQVEDAGDAMPQRMIGNACRALGIPFTDALPGFKDPGSSGPLFLFGDEIHLNAQGHALLARILLQR
jgi:hypothetical protein